MTNNVYVKFLAPLKKISLWTPIYDSISIHQIEMGTRQIVRLCRVFTFGDWGRSSRLWKMGGRRTGTKRPNEDYVIQLKYLKLCSWFYYCNFLQPFFEDPISSSHILNCFLLHHFNWILWMLTKGLTWVKRY